MSIFAWNRLTPHSLWRVGLAIAVFLTLDLLWIQLKFPLAARQRTFAASELPGTGAPVLILGASVSPDKEPSPVLQQRLQAALDLYAAGKVRWFLVSGDNRSPYYNEPITMRKWLIRNGVPPTLIVSDFAGRRTWDSLRRAKTIFGVERLVIVTSGFHLPRALYIAETLGMDASGVPSSNNGRTWTTRCSQWIREYFARHVAVWNSWFPPDTTLGPREPTPDDWIRT